MPNAELEIARVKAAIRWVRKNIPAGFARHARLKALEGYIARLELLL